MKETNTSGTTGILCLRRRLRAFNHAPSDRKLFKDHEKHSSRASTNFWAVAWIYLRCSYIHLTCNRLRTGGKSSSSSTDTSSRWSRSYRNLEPSKIIVKNRAFSFFFFPLRLLPCRGNLSSFYTREQKRHVPHPKLRFSPPAPPAVWRPKPAELKGADSAGEIAARPQKAKERQFYKIIIWYLIKNDSAIIWLCSYALV